MTEISEDVMKRAMEVVFDLAYYPLYCGHNVSIIARAIQEAKRDGMLEAARMIEQNWVDGLPPMLVATAIRKGASHDQA